MTTIAIRQRTAAGTQGAGHGYLQRVRSFFGTVAGGIERYFGAMSMDHGSLLVRDNLAMDVDVARLTRI